MELLETSFPRLSGKHSGAPVLMQSEKINVEQLRAVGEHVGPLVWISDAVAEQRTRWVRNYRYQKVSGRILLSRLHLTAGTGL